MKKRTVFGIIMSLLMVIGMIPGIFTPAPASAAAPPPTTSITVTKYYSDGTTVMAQTTVDYSYMETWMPVYGDGVTHYYHQGPTFDSANLWDPG
jgi:hypothetical protein